MGLTVNPGLYVEGGVFCAIFDEGFDGLRMDGKIKTHDDQKSGKRRI